MPEVSVIVPSYNHASYIGAAIQSVINQTYCDLELIIVDDGSTDDSPRLLADLKHQNIRVVFQQNSGAHAAINRGLSMANGKYLAILNSDDLYHPQRIEKAVSILKARPEIGLVSSYIEIIDASGNRLGLKQGYKNCHPWPLEKPEKSFRALENLRFALLTENYLATTSNFVFPRTIYENVGEFRPLRYTHDWDFALRVARKAEIFLIDEPLLQYRVHSRNTIKEDKAAMIFEICWTLAVNLPAFVSSASFWRDSVEGNSVELLLNSLFTYHCEKVLSVMLLQNLHVNDELALSLLRPENQDRFHYMEVIRSVLKAQCAQPCPRNTNWSFSRFVQRCHSLVMRAIGHTKEGN